jgi:hypothetical protein
MFFQETKDGDIVFNEGDGVDLDTMTSAVFRDDMRKVLNVVGPCTNDEYEDNRDCLSLDFFHDLVSVGPCLCSSVDDHTFVPPISKVEVSFDGETNTIISSGIEESVDEVKKTPQRRNRFMRLKKLRRTS